MESHDESRESDSGEQHHPNCGSPVPAVRTDSMPAMPDDNYKGWPLHMMRYQRLHCPACGYDGDRLVLVAKTRWSRPQHKDAQ